MTVLLLVRHAVTATTGRVLTGRTPGIDLTDEGRQQAEGLARRLRALPVAALYASPVERCVQTLEPLAGMLGAEVRPMPELAEVDYGRWTGRSLRQLSRTTLWKRVHALPSSVRFPGGETLVDAQRRAVEGVERLAARHPRALVAAASHADIIRLVVAHLAGVHIDLFQRLVIAPASVTALALTDAGPRLLRVNDTGTLDDLRPPPDGRGRRTSGRTQTRPRRRA